MKHSKERRLSSSRQINYDVIAEITLSLVIDSLLEWSTDPQVIGKNARQCVMSWNSSPSYLKRNSRLSSVLDDKERGSLKRRNRTSTPCNDPQCMQQRGENVSCKSVQTNTEFGLQRRKNNSIMYRPISASWYRSVGDGNIYENFENPLSSSETICSDAENIPAIPPRVPLRLSPSLDSVESDKQFRQQRVTVITPSSNSQNKKSNLELRLSTPSDNLSDDTMLDVNDKINFPRSLLRLSVEDVRYNVNNVTLCSKITKCFSVRQKKPPNMKNYINYRFGQPESLNLRSHCARNSILNQNVYIPPTSGHNDPRSKLKLDEPIKSRPRSTSKTIGFFRNIFRSPFSRKSKSHDTLELGCNSIRNDLNNAASHDEHLKRAFETSKKSPNTPKSHRDSSSEFSNNFGSCERQSLKYNNSTCDKTGVYEFLHNSNLVTHKNELKFPNLESKQAQEQLTSESSCENITLHQSNELSCTNEFYPLMSDSTQSACTILADTTLEKDTKKSASIELDNCSSSPPTLLNIKTYNSIEKKSTSNTAPNSVCYDNQTIKKPHWIMDAIARSTGIQQKSPMSPTLTDGESESFINDIIGIVGKRKSCAAEVKNSALEVVPYDISSRISPIWKRDLNKVPNSPQNAPQKPPRRGVLTCHNLNKYSFKKHCADTFQINSSNSPVNDVESEFERSFEDCLSESDFQVDADFTTIDRATIFSNKPTFSINNHSPFNSGIRRFEESLCDDGINSLNKKHLHLLPGSFSKTNPFLADFEKEIPSLESYINSSQSNTFFDSTPSPQSYVESTHSPHSYSISTPSPKSGMDSSTSHSSYLNSQPTVEGHSKPQIIPTLCYDETIFSEPSSLKDKLENFSTGKQSSYLFADFFRNAKNSSAAYSTQDLISISSVSSSAVFASTMDGNTDEDSYDEVANESNAGLIENDIYSPSSRSDEVVYETVD